MDSLPNSLNPNKRLKEQFVSNLDGSSISEIAALLTIVPVLFLLRNFIRVYLLTDNKGRETFSRKDDDGKVASKSWRDYLCTISTDFLVIVFPMLLFFTVLADWAYLGAILLSSLLMLLVATRRSGITSGFLEQQPFSFRASVSSFRVALTIITCLCILAVDFIVFPRRYAKTETYGTSLMDLGVGSFVLANSIVSRQARHMSSVNWMTALKSTSPLLLLGFLRLVTTTGVDYQVHVAEYGVHWNFFFTLAGIAFLSSVANAPAKYSGILGLAVLIGYQTWLVHGLNTYLLSNERRADIISQNKEGIYSLLGYWPLYLLGVHVAYYLFYSDRSSVRTRSETVVRIFLLSSVFWLLTFFLENYVERVSRRTCNMAYVTWVLAQDLQALGIFMLSTCIPGSRMSALEEAFDRNLLASFLLANILTGLVNLSVDTLFTSSTTALLILISYAFTLSSVLGIVHFSGFRLKFW